MDLPLTILQQHYKMLVSLEATFVCQPELCLCPILPDEFYAHGIHGLSRTDVRKPAPTFITEGLFARGGIL